MVKLSAIELGLAIVGAGWLGHKVYTLVDVAIAKVKVVSAALKASSKK